MRFMKIKHSIPELQINKSPVNSLDVLAPLPPKQKAGQAIDVPTQPSKNLIFFLVSPARNAEIFQLLLVMSYGGGQRMNDTATK